MEVLVKYCREDPWEGLDLLREAIHRTPMRAGMRGNACVSFGVTPDALMDLWMRRLNEHGVRSFWIYDVLYGVDNFARLARIAKEYDSEVIGTVFFSLSPVHTDEYLSARAEEIAAVPEIDGVLFYDTAGVLDVDRLRTLVPKIIQAAGESRSSSTRTTSWAPPGSRTSRPSGRGSRSSTRPPGRWRTARPFPRPRASSGTSS
jgi:oxaloacetate decarboxylase alpha subunit